MRKAKGCLFSTNSKDINVKTREASIPTFSSSKPFGATTTQHIIPEHTPVSDQGALSSCVANATADAFEIIKGLEDPHSVKQLSRLFVYWNARSYHNETNKDEGTYIMYAMDALTKFGVCQENTWQYNESAVFSQPNIIAYKEGDDNTLKLENFYKIRNVGQERLKDIENAIRANHPVVFGTAIDDNFMQYTGGNKVFTTPINYNGFHAMVVVGVRYNPNVEFLIRNSWSTTWGENGHAWFDGNYMMSDLTSDLHVPTRMNDLLLKV